MGGWREGAEANHSGGECVQGVTGPNDDKCSAEGLTLQLPSGPSVSSAVILQSLSVLQALVRTLETVWVFFLQCNLYER